MKKLLLIASSALLAISTFAQGNLTFNNNGATAITNSVTGTPVANGTAVGLYYSTTAGAPDTAFTRAFGVGGSGNVSTNTAFNGQFFGGTRIINGVAAGEAANVQVRAWSTGFATYEDALAAQATDPNVLTGKGNVFSLVLGGGTTPTPSITGAGRLTPFQVTPGIIPEPSSIALGLLGLGAIVLFRRRK